MYMKTNDVTKKVMEKVVQYETKRSTNWIRRYWFFVGLVFVGIMYALIRTYIGYREFDEDFMVLWYFEDWELIKIVWKDALQFIWELVPQYWVYLTTFGIVILGIGIFGTKNKRKQVHTRLHAVKNMKKEGV